MLKIINMHYQLLYLMFFGFTFFLRFLYSTLNLQIQILLVSVITSNLWHHLLKENMSSPLLLQHTNGTTSDRDG